MSDTQLIKDKIDIVDFINEYVQLKPAGVNHKGLCPFHGEKTPSFMVSRERNSWHCFGCSKGGDIFSFLQEIEGMEFVEALRVLADRAGVPITFQGVGKEESSQKNRIKEINTAAARFFHNFLLKMTAAKIALDYLHTRGLTVDTIEEWQIGFIPDQWDLLTGYLLKKGHGIDDLVASGLTIERDGANRASGRGFYDRFRGRIMFPIQDIHNQVVGFTGRVLVETEKSGGKYVNTPQTAVYDKSRVVFGLNKAKQEIKSKDLIVMVEGQTDVISCHQAGMKNVVATSGTALTLDQIKLLKRYSSNMNMAFDADEAGQKAAKRGIDLGLEEGMNIKVIKIPDGFGKDPDECIKNNPDIWSRAVENAKHIMSWYLERALERKDLSDPKQKQLAADAVLPEIARVPYAVEKDHWLRELGSRLGVDVGILRDDLGRFGSNRSSQISNRQSDDKNNKRGEKIQLSRLELLLDRFFSSIIKFPNRLQITDYRLPESMLSPTRYLPLYQALMSGYTDVSKLRKEVNFENEENLVDILLLKRDLDYTDMDEADTKQEARMLVSQIHEEWARERRLALQREIDLAEKAGNKDKLAGLMSEFQEVNL